MRNEIPLPYYPQQPTRNYKKSTDKIYTNTKHSRICIELEQAEITRKPEEKNLKHVTLKKNLKHNT